MLIRWLMFGFFSAVAVPNLIDHPKLKEPRMPMCVNLFVACPKTVFFHRCGRGGLFPSDVKVFRSPIKSFRPHRLSLTFSLLPLRLPKWFGLRSRSPSDVWLSFLPLSLARSFSSSIVVARKAFWLPLSKPCRLLIEGFFPPFGHSSVASFLSAVTAIVGLSAFDAIILSIQWVPVSCQGSGADVYLVVVMQCMTFSMRSHFCWHHLNAFPMNDASCLNAGGLQKSVKLLQREGRRA